MWKEIAVKPVFTNVDQYADDYYIRLTRESVKNRGIDITPLINIISEYVDESIIRETDKELIISTFNMSERKQQYYSLDDIPDGQLLDYAAASARLPFFKDVIIDNQKYIDGGIGDNIPYYSKLKNKNFDLVITIKITHIPFFIPRVSVNNITYHKEILIKPSKRIGSPLEFRKPTFDQKYEMGYEDTKRALMQIDSRIL
jgi:NTE family protein